MCVSGGLLLRHFLLRTPIFIWGRLVDYSALMAQADALSLRGLGKTCPNPIVGALIVDSSGAVISQDFHDGGLHAEAKAINKIREIPKGATLITTLEPCNHYGKTPPCSDLIVKSGIKKVVFAVSDQNLVAKGGADHLRAAQVDVIGGVLQDQVTYSNRFWLNKIKNNRPYFIWKIGMTLDGKVCAKDGNSKWITSESSRAQVSKLRSQSDVILIGTGTALADNPSLNTREENVKQPRRLVMGHRLIPPASNLKDQSAQTYFLHSHNLDVLLDFLAKLEVNQVLVEAGPTLGTFLMKSGVIDEMHIYLSPSLLGSGQSFIDDLGINSLENRVMYKVKSTEMVDTDLKIILAKNQ
ncbi:MAG: bifunctional diaminohydroxyphosphoribosylaminopyrimidine deaminase/5-amino-6-(5-phosphoribosylamino)uracil reductase RibD [Actinobacteria bacterium]|nr:bifunctional diaminohydroxyphosphoribosylaminopyrimidine deaminase/5-amino-6-(5-phosphoribosylamino)uracil reductase RibD [Actinomycetota bacterium]